MIYRRLASGGNRILWSEKDVERVARYFGASLRDLDPLIVHRDMAGPSAPMADSDAQPMPPISAEFPFVISTQSTDHSLDQINVSGWNYDTFNRNPIVQYSHNSGVLPVGITTKRWIENNRVMARVKFSQDAASQRVAAQVNEGVLRGASVGFIPGEWDFSTDPKRKGGIDFTRGHTLLEWSVCNIPCNPDCLSQISPSQGKSLTPSLDAARLKLLRLKYGMPRL
jgi:hypothetical protein